MYFKPHSINNINRSNIYNHSSWYHSFYEFFQLVYMRFLLTTALYVMEPWERVLVMSIVFLIISLVSYSALVYIPYHLQHVLHWILPSFSNALL